MHPNPDGRTLEDIAHRAEDARLARRYRETELTNQAIREGRREARRERAARGERFLWVEGITVHNLVLKRTETELVVCTGERYRSRNAHRLRESGEQIDPIPQSYHPCGARSGHVHYVYKRIIVEDYAWRDIMRAMFSWDSLDHEYVRLYPAPEADSGSTTTE